jgi:hypothetical protein
MKGQEKYQVLKVEVEGAQWTSAVQEFGRDYRWLFPSWGNTLILFSKSEFTCVHGHQ